MPLCLLGSLRCLDKIFYVVQYNDNNEKFCIVVSMVLCRLADSPSKVDRYRSSHDIHHFYQLFELISTMQLLK